MKYKYLIVLQDLFVKLKKKLKKVKSILLKLWIKVQYILIGTANSFYCIMSISELWET